MNASLNFPLPVVLGALDRLSLNEPTRLLAKDLARVCESEGVVASPEALAQAAQQQLAASPKEGVDANEMLHSQWNRPTSAIEWEKRKTRVARTLRRLKWMGWSAGLVFLVMEGMCLSHSIPEKGVWFFLGVIVCGAVGSLACLIMGEEKARIKVQLTEHIPNEDERAHWNNSTLAQAYLRAHVSEDLPIMKGDLPWLNELVADEKRANQVLAAQASIHLTG